MGEGKDVGKPQPDLNVAQGERENAKRSELADEDAKRKRGQHTTPSTKIAAFKVFLLFFILTFFMFIQSDRCWQRGKTAKGHTKEESAGRVAQLVLPTRVAQKQRLAGAGAITGGVEPPLTPLAQATPWAGKTAVRKTAVNQNAC